MTHCLRGVQGLIDAHEQFKATLGEADKEYTTIVSLSQEVIRLGQQYGCLLYTSPSPRDDNRSRMPSSA